MDPRRDLSSHSNPSRVVKTRPPKGSRRSSELADSYKSVYPSLFPTIPTNLIVPSGLENPFIRPNEATRHPRLYSSRDLDEEAEEAEGVKELVVVNGFVKAGFDPTLRTNTKSPLKFFRPIQDTPPPLQVLTPAVFAIPNLCAPQPLPRDFGGVSFHGPLDQELFEFFIHGICRGRTVIPNDNAYLQEIVPIARTSELVRHSLFALPPSYMLDYVLDTRLKEAAQEHYMQACHLLTAALENRATYDPNSHESIAVVAALILLSHNEAVNWQTHQAGEREPKWYLADKLAAQILRASDPAVRYRNPEAVQLWKARFAFGQLNGLDTVLSDALFHLDLDADSCPFAWTLYGTEMERARIVGMTGISPQLLHYLSKITFLSAQVMKELNIASTKPGPQKEIDAISILREISVNLGTLQQYSAITDPCTAEDVFGNVCLDDETKVVYAADVTLLITACYVDAAQIYLQCRGLRRPRSHYEVQYPLLRLLMAIRWQPTKGNLFTAQTPLFAVFVAGLVATAEQRSTIKTWFRETMDDSRGNVKPIWEALCYIWERQAETNNFGETVDVDDPAKAHPWWETMVEDVVKARGRLSLS